MSSLFEQLKEELNIKSLEHFLTQIVQENSNTLKHDRMGWKKLLNAAVSSIFSKEYNLNCSFKYGTSEDIDKISQFSEILMLNNNNNELNKYKGTLFNFKADEKGIYQLAELSFGKKLRYNDISIKITQSKNTETYKVLFTNEIIEQGTILDTISNALKFDLDSTINDDYFTDIQHFLNVYSKRSQRNYSFEDLTAEFKESFILNEVLKSNDLDLRKTIIESVILNRSISQEKLEMINLNYDINLIDSNFFETLGKGIVSESNKIKSKEIKVKNSLK